MSKTPFLQFGQTLIPKTRIFPKKITPKILLNSGQAKQHAKNKDKLLQLQDIFFMPVPV